MDLAALAPTLIEAELFGHEEGAYTGATRARLGRFRRAEGGTLVLDGVDGLPPEAQGKLLRALQERKVEPLGSEFPIPVDVRVVATSTEQLSARVEAGQFREDLYYRLAVVRLEVPPLRARADELPDLVRELTASVAARLRAPVREPDEAALARLVAHPWPGNLRELENALERVTVLTETPGAPIEAAELFFLGEAVADAAERLAREARAHGIGLDDLSRAMLEGALAEARENVSEAARRLGLSRRAFEYRMGKLEPKAEDTP